jgi:hypothetical protein
MEWEISKYQGTYTSAQNTKLNQQLLENFLPVNIVKLKYEPATWRSVYIRQGVQVRFHILRTPEADGNSSEIRALAVLTPEAKE